MADRDRALQLIRTKGPVVPSNISKELGKNILFTSVILSELVASKLLKMSSLKVGSSPLYYIPGQESRLEEFHSYLNEKDRRTYAFLKSGKVLREKDQDPLVRVSLAQIKDFAVPLEVTIKGEKEIFWKWHGLTNEEATPLIREILEGPKKQEITEEPVRQPAVETVLAAPAKEETEAEDIEEEKIPRELFLPKRPRAERTESQQLLKEPDDPFYQKVKKYLQTHDATIIHGEVTKKGKEVDLEIIIRTKLGNLPYFCRAKDKKHIQDPDLASAYVKAQMMKLPLLFLATGDLSKKASAMMQEEFSSVAFKTM